MKNTRKNINLVYKDIAFKVLGEKCKYCNSTKRLNIHHKDLDFTNNSLDNLLLICSKCHGTKHNLLVQIEIRKKKGVSKKILLKQFSELRDFLPQADYNMKAHELTCKGEKK